MEIKKSVYPKDWSNLTNDEAMVYIGCLKDNIDGMVDKIKTPWGNTLRIGDVKIKYKPKNVTYSINNKKFVLDGINAPSEEWFAINSLFFDSKKIKQQQRKQRWNKNKPVVFVTGAIALSFGVLLVACFQSEKKQEQEKQQFKQDVIQGVLDGLKKEQVATINTKTR